MKACNNTSRLLFIFLVVIVSLVFWKQIERKTYATDYFELKYPRYSGWSVEEHGGSVEFLTSIINTVEFITLEDSIDNGSTQLEYLDMYLQDRYGRDINDELLAITIEEANTVGKRFFYTAFYREGVIGTMQVDVISVQGPEKHVMIVDTRLLPEESKLSNQTDRMIRSLKFH